MTRARPAAGFVLAGLALATVLFGCDGAIKPAPPDIDTVGALSGVNESDDRITYTLADGRRWARPDDAFRILYDLPSGPTLFVAGRDQTGEYVLLIGGQEGLPADCPYALRYGGIDWGDSIEAHGLLWPKAGDFVAMSGGPGNGSAYPSNAVLCLDDRGGVSSITLLEPPDGSPPVPSTGG